MSDELVMAVLCGLAIAIGVIGTLVPVLPGLVLVWLAMLVFGLTTSFGVVGWVAMGLGTVLVLVGFYLGVRIPQRSAARSGLSVRGQLTGALLAIVGFFAIPVIGAPLGFMVGVWWVRLRQSGDATAAWRSTRETMGSLLKASAAQALCGIGMAGSWAAWATLVVGGRITGG